MQGTVIVHSGIKGQKWGHKNGPPYPLKNSDRSPAEKKKNKESASSKALKISKNVERVSGDANKVAKAVGSSVAAVTNKKMDPLGKVASVATSSKSLTDVAAKTAGEIYEKKHKKNYDTSQYSVDELQRKVNRMRNEQEYENKTGKKLSKKLTDKEALDAVRRINLNEEYNRIKNADVKRGREKVENSINLAGSIAAIVAGTATTAFMIKKMVEGSK